MGRSRVPSLVTVVVAVATVLVGCSSSGSGKSAPGTTAGSASAASASSASTATTAPPVLTASFRGVTPTEIKIGIVNIDYTCINQFVDYNFGDQKAISQVFLDDLNAHGGILGRKVVAVYKNYCPIGNTQALATCTSITEDEKVFAVLGILYDASGDADLCLTRDHQTIYDGFELDQAWIDQSPPGLMVTVDYPRERRTQVLLNLLKSQGTLTGKKVAIFTDQNNAASVTKVVKPALDAMGVAQGSQGVVTIVGSDTSAAQSQLDSYVEKWKGEGVNAIFLAGLFVASKQFVEKIKKQMPDVLLITDGFSSAQLAGQDETAAGVKPNPFDGMITADGPSESQQWQLPSVQDCVKTYQTATGQTVVGPDDLKPDANGKRVRVWAAIRDFCGQLSFFKQIATKAGPNLTNDTWAAAVDGFGKIQLVDTPYASVHEGKYGANDAFGLCVFDSTYGPKGDFKHQGPIQDVPG
jgi:ABC-type branched-subunit amino acid transport system substrate-binding protein